MDFASLIIFALPLLLLFWLFSRQRRLQREATMVQSTLEPGRRVMMTSGVYGEIVSVGEAGTGDDEVVVELAPGVRTTWARQAVARVLPPDEPHNEAVQNEAVQNEAVQDQAARDEAAAAEVPPEFGSERP